MEYQLQKTRVNYKVFFSKIVPRPNVNMQKLAFTDLNGAFLVKNAFF
tara:strand:- start:961 stop:1101 length:141 start_codon:yes stop_codon:yes gene_type:complete